MSPVRLRKLTAVGQSPHGTTSAGKYRNFLMTRNRPPALSLGFRRLPLMLGLFAFLASPAGRGEPIQLPELQDESAGLFSPLQERKLGEDFMRKARQRLDILDDAEINDYLRTLGHRLVSRSGRAPDEFRFFIVRDPNVNAFAVPGGFIGVNTGLILATENEAELAAVLAHETAHITQRHLPRMLAEAKRLSVPAMAAMLAAILLAGSGGQAGGAAATLTAATVAQQQLNYTRAFEQEADRIGMGILTAAGYDARAMPTFFERLLNWSKLYESDLPEFLRTHPITTRRIAESRDQAERYPARAATDNQDFFHIQAKIRALAKGSPETTANAFGARLGDGNYRQLEAERYGYAWALSGNRQFEAARREIGKLLERRPDYVLYRIAQAEIEMSAGRTGEALAIYRAALRRFPGHRALEQRYASALLRTGEAKTAHELLRKTVRQQPGEPALYKMLATAAGETGARLEAHQALAEYHYLSGNPQAALEQLHIARKLAGDSFYARSSVEARIQEIKDEMALHRE
jgi:predicted Zn-dependent protease